MKAIFGILTALLLTPALASAQDTSSQPAAPSAQQAASTEWWREAKFGMFIHWGLYAEPARGEWVMNKERIPIAEYKKLAGNFNPLKFNATEWVAIAKAAGMKYITITSKHHDGFALFDSAVSDFNLVAATPFKRDVIQELSEACAKEGIKFGVYYSQAQDWSHPGGSMAPRGYWDPAQIKGKEAFEKYLRTISIPQMKEVIKIAKPSHIWFDTPIGMDARYGGEIVQAIRSVKPDTLLNSRLLYHGSQVEALKPDQLAELKDVGVDFLSYRDRTIPAETFAGWEWETCMTLNGAWGFTKRDQSWKSPAEVVKMLSQVARKGGNFLLNFGPTAEGEIPPAGVGVVKQVGDWLRVNGEAIYGTYASDLKKTGALEYGPGVKADGSMKADGGKKQAHGAADFDWLATARPAETGVPAKIYLHVFKWPAGQLAVKGITGKVQPSGRTDEHPVPRVSKNATTDSRPD
jgi:alpha-L-fucosidase